MKNTANSTVGKDVDMSVLLGDLGYPIESDDDVIIEQAETAIVGDFDHEAAVIAKINNQEILEDHYAAEEVSVVADAVVPAAAKPAHRGKMSEADKAAALAAKEAKKLAAAEVKAARPVRKFFANKSERVVAGVGFSVLTLADAELTGADLDAKVAEEATTFGGAGTKVQNRMTNVYEYVGGRPVKLNPVQETALAVLKRDGYLKSGDKGNFHLELVKGGRYSVASARAMGNNSLAAFRLSKTIIKVADGSYHANPESLVYLKLQSMGH